MTCANHAQKEAIGTCVGCGKFICGECNTEVNGKNYCKKCIAEMMAAQNKKLEKLEDNKTSAAQAVVGQPPMVFMNAGGGGGSSSSSSSSSSAAAGGMTRGMPYPRQSIMLHVVLFIFTAGIGNVIYYLYIKGKQRQWHMVNGG